MKRKKEIWKPLIYKGISYSERLEISNYGNLRNIKTKKVYAVSILKDKSRRVTISLGSRDNKLTIHLSYAVAENFIYNENKEKYNLVIHKDGVSSNDYYENLIWGNRSIQSILMKKHKSLFCAYGENNSQHKLSLNDVIFIRENCVPYSKGLNITKMAKLFGVSASSISLIYNKKNWKNI